MLIVFLVIIAATFAPIIAGHTPNQQNLSRRLSPPSKDFPLGTDQFGRDILARLLDGARISLVVGLSATLISGLVGIALGALAGWWSGWLGNAIMRGIDVFLAFPSIILAIALVAVFGAGIEKVILVLSITRMPQFARVSHSALITIRESEYIAAARALGRRPLGLVIRHALPNSLGPLAVYAAFSIATAIGAEAGLSFLGLGVQPPQSSWGAMLSDAQTYIMVDPGMAVFPGIAVTLTVTAFNLLGDGLRDLTDPRTRGS